MLLDELPEDIVYKISLYVDTVKYRGSNEYAYQISKTDVRYELLKTVPRFRSYYHSNISTDSTHCGLFVYLQKSPKTKKIQINYQIETKILTIVYFGLLHKQPNNNSDYVVFTQSFSIDSACSIKA